MLLHSTISSRCCAVKFSFKHCNDLIVVSVYMPCLNGSCDPDIDYESIVGCMQGIIDNNRGCNFVFGGDFNLSKHQVTSNAYYMLSFVVETVLYG